MSKRDKWAFAVVFGALLAVVGCQLLVNEVLVDQQPPALAPIPTTKPATRAFRARFSWQVRSLGIVPGVPINIYGRANGGENEYELLVEAVPVLAVDEQDGWSARLTLEVTASQAALLDDALRADRVTMSLHVPNSAGRSITFSDILRSSEAPAIVDASQFCSQDKLREQIAEREKALREVRRFLAEAQVWLADAEGKRDELTAELNKIIAVHEDQLKRLHSGNVNNRTP